MPVQIGSDRIGACYIGSDRISKIYIGADLVFDKFVSDALDDTNGTDLDAHVGEIGAVWASHPSYSGVAEIQSNKLIYFSGTSFAYYSSGVPPNANYYVQADFTAASTNAGGTIGIAARMSTSANTFYHVRYTDHDGAGWKLYKFVAGTATKIGEYNVTRTLSQVYKVRLECNGTTIRVLIDDVERINVTDSSISAANRAGVRGFNEANDDTLDNYIAGSL